MSGCPTRVFYTAPRCSFGIDFFADDVYRPVLDSFERLADVEADDAQHHDDDAAQQPDGDDEACVTEDFNLAAQGPDHGYDREDEGKGRNQESQFHGNLDGLVGGGQDDIGGQPEKSFEIVIG